MANIGSLTAHLGVDTTGLKSASRDFASFESTTLAGLSNITKAAGAAATAFASFKLFQVGKDAVMFAANVEQANVALGSIANSMGRTKIEAYKYRDSLRDINISTNSATNATAQFLKSGFPLEKLNQLGTAAQGAAISYKMMTGETISSSEALDKMVRSLVTGNVTELHTLGINVMLRDILRENKVATGEAATAVDSHHRKLLMLNEVLENTAPLMDLYADSTGLAAKNISSSKRPVEELKLALGNLFLPELTAASAAFYKTVADGMKWVRENKKEMDGWRDSISSVSGVMTSFMGHFGPDIIAAAKILGVLTAAQLAFNVAVSKNPYVLGAMALVTLNEALRAYGMNLGALPDKFFAAKDAANDLAKSIFSGISEGQTTLIGQLELSIKNLREEIELGANVKKPWYLFELFPDMEGKKKELGALQAQLAQLNKADANKAYAAEDASFWADQKKAQLDAIEEVRVAKAKAALADKATHDEWLARQEEVKKEAEQLAKQWEQTAQTLNKEIRLSGLSDIDAEVMEITIHAEEMRKEFGNKELITSWENTTKAIVAQKEEIKQIVEQYQVLADNQKELKSIQDDYAAVVRDILPEEQRLVAEINAEYEKKREVIERASAAGIASAADVELQMAQLNQKEKENIDETLKRHRETSKGVATLWDHSFERISDSMADWLATGENGLKGLLQSFTQMVAQMVTTWIFGQKQMSAAQSASMGGNLLAAGPVMAGSSTGAGRTLGYLSTAVGLYNEWKNPGSYATSMGTNQATLASGLQSVGLGTVGYGAGAGAYGAAGYGTGSFAGASLQGGATPLWGATPTAGTGAAGTVGGMSSAAFGGYTAGIGTFVMSMMQGDEFKDAAIKGGSTGVGAWGGANLGAAYGSSLGPIGAAAGAVIGAVLSGLLGNALTGKSGGPDRYTPGLLNNLTDDSWSKYGGFSPVRKDTVPSHYSYPAANAGLKAYTQGVGKLQDAFDTHVESLKDQMSAAAWKRFTTTLSKVKFKDADLGKVKVSSVAEVTEAMLVHFAGELDRGLNLALKAVLPVIAKEMVINDKNFKYLDTALQRRIKSLTKSKAFTPEMLGELDSYMDQIAAAFAPIEEAFTTRGLNQYALQLRSIRKEFDDYETSLHEAGVSTKKYTRLKQLENLAIKDLIKDARSESKGLLASYVGTEFARAMQGVTDWYKEQVALANSLKSSMTSADFKSWMRDLNKVATFQRMELIDEWITPITKSWEDFFKNIALSDLAPSQSVEGLQQRYLEFKNAATDGIGDAFADSEAFQSFVTDIYLPFMQTYAPGNYQQLFDDTIEEIGRMDIKIADVSISAIGTSFAETMLRLFPESFFDGNGNITIVVDADPRAFSARVVQDINETPEFRSVIAQIAR